MTEAAGVRKAVFLAVASDVDLASFAASAVLHHTVFQMGVVTDRLVPVFVEDLSGSSHFASVDSVSSVCSVSAESVVDTVASSLRFVLSSDSVVELLAAESSFVLCASVRASSASLDPYSGQVLMERSVAALSVLVRALAVPYSFSWGSGNLVLWPTVHLSVVAEAGTGWDSAMTLVHGVVMRGAGSARLAQAAAVAKEASEKLRDFERVAAQATRTTPCGELGFGLRTAAFLMGMLDIGFRQVVIIADGVASAPEMSTYDCPLMMLRREGITVSVVQTAAYQPFQTLGCVPSCESLQQLAMSAGGFYYDFSSNSELCQLEISDSAELLNVLNHSLVSREWRARPLLTDILLLPRASYAPYLKHHHQDERNVLSEVLLEPSEFNYDIMVLNQPYPWEGEAPCVPVLRQMVHEYHLSCDCWSLLSARLQEGFRFLSLEAEPPVDGCSDFVLSLWLAWLPNVKLVYTIASTADIAFDSAMQRPSNVTLYVYAHYEFLLRLSQATKDSKRIAPGVAAIQAFVKRVLQTDKILNRLSVNSCAVLSTCEALPSQNGGWTLPFEHQEAFWQMIASLGQGSLQRWFHLKHLVFVLRPDKFDVSNLTANEDVSFGMSRNALLSDCRDWAAFSTGGSYFCRLIALSNDRPTGFCLLRPLFPTPSVAVLQFSLFGGSQRQLEQQVQEFQDRVQSRGGRVVQLACSFFPALMAGDGAELQQQQQQLAAVLPSAGMFPGPAHARLSALQWSKNWSWKIVDAALRARLIAMLRRNRVMDRFFVLCWQSGTFVLELPLNDGRVARMQCRVREAGEAVLLEHWIEPVWNDGRDAFDRVLRHMHANDLRVVTEIFTWRVINDLLENKPPMVISFDSSGALSMVGGPPPPPVSAEALLRGARSSHSVTLDAPECVDSGLLFALLCRSLNLLCGCAVRDGSSLIPSAFASSSSQKNMVLTRAFRDKARFIVEVAEVRYMRLGIPTAPESPKTSKLLGFDGVVGAPGAEATGSSRRQLRPDAMAIASFATQLHRRNVVRAVYGALEEGQFVPAGQLQSLVFDACIEVTLEVNVSELIAVAADLPPSAEREGHLRERFQSALSGALFVPISGASEFVYAPPAERKQTSLVTSDALDSDRPVGLPPVAIPPPSAAATWDEESLMTLKEIEMFGAGAGFPCFLRLVLEQLDRSNPVLPRVVESKSVNSIPLVAAPNPKMSFVLKLACLTLPPYRMRGGDVNSKSRMRRIPDVVEVHSPFRSLLQVTDLPLRLQTAMVGAKQRMEDFVSWQIADLLRFVALTQPKRELLVRAVRNLARAGSSLVLREIWAPRLCRDSGPRLVQSMLQRVAFEALGMRQLVDGGPVAVWSDVEPVDAPQTHWLLLEPADDGGMQALLFVGSLSEEEQRNHLREANVKVWEPLLRAVNQVSLLRELHETRCCPTLLDAPEGQDANFSAKDARFGGAGSLACPMQGPETWLRLPPRCTWEQARRFTARSLQLFAVEDRANLFVYHESGDYWYFRVLYHAGNNAAEGSSVSLSFFGLSPPPLKLREDVARLISTALHQAAVSVLAQEAARNHVIKSSKMELEFLRSGDSGPSRHYLQLPIVARCALRVRWWELFRQGCGSLRPLWLEGKEAPSVNLFIFAPSAESLALLLLHCHGTTERCGNAASTPQEFLSPMYNWTNLPLSDQDMNGDEEVPENETSLEFGIFATVWPLGQMSPPEILDALSASLYKARARLGIEVALGALSGGEEWNSLELSQLWELLDRSCQTSPGASFRLKQLALLSCYLRPLASTVAATLALDLCSVLFQRDADSRLEKLQSDDRVDGMLFPRCRLVVQARATHKGEPAVLLAIISKDELVLRSYGFQESVVKAVRDACTQFLSWVGLRTYLLQSVAFAKLGVPFHREVGKNRVRLTESLVEAAALGPFPPGGASLSSSSSRLVGNSNGNISNNNNNNNTNNSLDVSLRPSLALAVLPDHAPSKAFFGSAVSTLSSDASKDVVSRQITHWLSELALRAERARVGSAHSSVRLLSINSGDLFGAEAASVNTSASPSQTVVPVPAVAVGKVDTSEPFYSYPRSTPLRLETHATWLRRLAAKELRHSLLAHGFQMVSPNESSSDQIIARLDVPGRGRIEVTAGFRNRLTAFGKAVLVTSSSTAEEDEKCSMTELCRLCQLATRVVTVRALAVDVACLALAALASGSAEPRDCWARGVARAVCEAAGAGAGGRCQAQSVELSVALPQDKTSDCNSFEAMRYLSSHSSDYGLDNLVHYGLEPVLALSLPAPLMIARSGFSDLRLWGLAGDSDISQEHWTILAMYLHVRGEADKSKLRLRVVLARTPVSTRAVGSAVFPLDSAVFSSLLAAPARRVLGDFSREQQWRALHQGIPGLDLAALSFSIAPVPAPLGNPSSTTLTNALRACAAQSWDALLSHLQRWRPALLRPFVQGSTRHVLVLQRGSSNPTGSPTSSLKSVALPRAPEDGLLPELGRIQAGAVAQVPDFAVLLTRNEGAASLSCAVVRRRGGGSESLLESEASELDQLARALAIWLWMLKGETKK